jgi:hypothetical protein
VFLSTMSHKHMHLLINILCSFLPSHSNILLWMFQDKTTMAAKRDLNKVILFDFFICHYTIYSLIEMVNFISDKSKIFRYGIILFSILFSIKPWCTFLLENNIPMIILPDSLLVWQLLNIIPTWWYLQKITDCWIFLQ